MEKMAALVANIMQNQHLQKQAPGGDENAAKKRKVAASPIPVKTQELGPVSVPSGVLEKPVDLESLDELSVDLDSIVAPKPPPAAAAAPVAAAPVPPAPFANSSQQSTSSFTSTDEEILSSLFALESTDDVNVVREMQPADLQNFRFPEKKPRAEASAPPAVPPTNEPDPVLMKKLRSALSVLPKNLQEMFVDRIVTFVVDPDSFKKQVDAVSNLAIAAASEARNRVGGNFVDANQANSLASAILGAWLSKYGSGSNNTNNTSRAQQQVLSVVSGAPAPMNAAPTNNAPAPIMMNAPAPMRNAPGAPMAPPTLTFNNSGQSQQSQQQHNGYLPPLQALQPPTCCCSLVR